MALDDTRARLAAEFARTKRPPNELIITIQKDMLETLGFEREWACSMLNRLSIDFPNDQELGRAMQVWAMTAQAACKQAVAENASFALQAPHVECEPPRRSSSRGSGDYLVDYASLRSFFDLSLIHISEPTRPY